jgi:hypothetical protein
MEKYRTVVRKSHGKRRRRLVYRKEDNIKMDLLAYI